MFSVQGVHFLKTVKRPKGSWQARIELPDGKRIHKTFSVLKFGRREAFQRAVVARADMLLKIEDRPYIKHSTAKRLTTTRTDTWEFTHPSQNQSLIRFGGGSQANYSLVLER